MLQKCGVVEEKYVYDDGTFGFGAQLPEEGLRQHEASTSRQR